MTDIHSTSPETNLKTQQPDPALKRLDVLVGTWEISGRTLDAQEDNIRGRVTIEWLPGGFFLQQRGELEVMGFKVQSLEIVGYDPATKTFPGTVFSNVDGVVGHYQWEVQGNVVAHWTAEARHTGTFSEDGNVLAGGWRPDEGNAASAGNAYDATMTRVK